MSFCEIFRKIQDNRTIKGKDLAELTSINQKHLSQFRQGKSSVSLDLLWRLLEAMDELSPGARRDFGLMIAGEPVVYEEMDEVELADQVVALGQAWKKKAQTKEVLKVKEVLKI